MKIGIIGSGIVAQVIGKAFLTEGEEIMIGSRDPQKDSIKKWEAASARICSKDFTFSPFGEAIHFSIDDKQGCYAKRKKRKPKAYTSLRRQSYGLRRSEGVGPA